MYTTMPIIESVVISSIIVSQIASIIPAAFVHINFIPSLQHVREVSLIFDI